MKRKRLFSFLLSILLALSFAANTSALNSETLENPASWPNPVEAPMQWGSVPQEKCVYFADAQKNRLYISITIKSDSLSTPSASAQVIITKGDTRQLVDLSENTESNSENGISTQTKLLMNSSGYYQYVAAVEFEEKTQYEIMVVYIINGAEARMKNSIFFDSTPPSTVKETTTKATKASTEKNTTTKKDTKTATNKQASKNFTAPAYKAKQNTAGGSSAPSFSEETTIYEPWAMEIDDTKNFFQSMSKPARAVFIAAVILGSVALIAVGMALGNRNTKQQETTQLEAEEDNNDSTKE